MQRDINNIFIFIFQKHLYRQRDSNPGRFGDGASILPTELAVKMSHRLTFLRHFSVTIYGMSDTCLNYLPCDILVDISQSYIFS